MRTSSNSPLISYLPEHIFTIVDKLYHFYVPKDGIIISARMLDLIALVFRASIFILFLSELRLQFFLILRPKVHRISY